VTLGCLAPRMLQLDVLDDRAGNGSKVLCGGPQVPLDMAARETPCQVKGAVQHQHPGKEEMPVPGIRQVRIAWQCQPIRPGARGLLTLFPRDTEDAGGVESQWADDGTTAETHGRLDGFQRHERLVGVSPGLTPVEPWVRVEDVEPAADEDEDRQRIDPMGQANRPGMAVNDFPLRSGRGDRKS